VAAAPGACLCLLLLAIGLWPGHFFAQRWTCGPAAASDERQIILLVDTSASMQREGLWNKGGKRFAGKKYLAQSRPRRSSRHCDFRTRQPACARQLRGMGGGGPWIRRADAGAGQRLAGRFRPGWMATASGPGIDEPPPSCSGKMRAKAASRRELGVDHGFAGRLQAGMDYRDTNGPTGVNVIIERVEAKQLSNAGLEIFEPMAGAPGRG